MSDYNILVKKLHDEAQMPFSSSQQDAGYDLFALDDGHIETDSNGKILYIQYRTGISVQTPSSVHLEILPRSSISKTSLMLANSVGLIDEGYRGEILVRFKIIDGHSRDTITTYNKGDRIAQIVVRESIHADFEEVEELDDTQRGVGGFGSTGA